MSIRKPGLPTCWRTSASANYCRGTGAKPRLALHKPLTPRAGFSAAEKARFTAACERLIDQVLKPRYLPSIRPTKFNYPVDILGKWRGAQYRFIQRYRSGFPGNPGEGSMRPSPASTASASIASTSNGAVTPESGSAFITA